MKAFLSAATTDSLRASGAVTSFSRKERACNNFEIEYLRPWLSSLMNKQC
jgi:hypothetical protein